ncbi:DUF3716 domain-containing protein [Methanolobus vulcani]|uniref:DUF3716 domain-containing protein n=1 Tax=Methanolobus vulcani TaxID=38026 RepID=A0A7Z8KNX7_9EURY|nr:DUF3716 domain-containing protein [Methanolobus vulcani]
MTHGEERISRKITSASNMGKLAYLREIAKQKGYSLCLVANHLENPKPYPRCVRLVVRKSHRTHRHICSNCKWEKKTEYFR